MGKLQDKMLEMKIKNQIKEMSQQELVDEMSKNKEAKEGDISNKSVEVLLSEIIEYQESHNYYMRKNNSLLKGIAFVLWFGFACSIIAALMWLNSI